MRSLRSRASCSECSEGGILLGFGAGDAMSTSLILSRVDTGVCCLYNEKDNKLPRGGTLFPCFPIASSAETLAGRSADWRNSFYGSINGLGFSCYSVFSPFAQQNLS